MNMDTLLRVSGLTKQYRLQGEGEQDAVNVLNNVSFDLRKGDSIGLIGRNGSGKTTLLKILAGFIKPTSGTVEINGKVNSLIEVGGNFIPDLTGRENVRNYLKFYGVPQDELDATVLKVEEFGELGRYFGQPVKNYSSGMFVRASVSAGFHVKADIFLIDEILMAGDVSFREKVSSYFKKLRNDGAGIILASHSPDEVVENCSECCWIDEGTITERRTSAEVLKSYYQKYAQKHTEQREQIHRALTSNNDADLTAQDSDRADLRNELMEVEQFHVSCASGVITRGTGFDVHIRINKLTDRHSLHPTIKIYNIFLSPIIGILSMNDPVICEDLNSQRQRTGIICYSCTLPPNLLAAGTYYIDFILTIDPEPESTFIREGYRLPCKLRVDVERDARVDYGIGSLDVFVRPDAKWTVY
jgi:ABC-type polysaccharide/polyol phosphate transport system ATPase subunit